LSIVTKETYCPAMFLTRWHKLPYLTASFNTIWRLLRRKTQNLCR
jgi:hypothetical protein